MHRRFLLILPLALVACASADTAQTITLVGVVEAVDATSREVLIRGLGHVQSGAQSGAQSGVQSGVLLSMVAGRAVRRMNQIRPGDRVTVVYYQAIAAQAVRPISTAAVPFAGMSIAREADRPGGEFTRVRSGRVTITAVDAANTTVSFTGPGGLIRTVTATNAQVRAFIRQLRVGEQVDMIYEEALAISIDPMR